MANVTTDPHGGPASSGHGAAAPPPASGFRLLVDGKENPVLELEVPPGVSTLTVARNRTPRLGAAGRTGGDVLLEPARHEGVPRLLLVREKETPVRVNDQLAPCAVLLREGDQFGLAGGPIFEVAFFHRPVIGAPPAELLRKPCLLCRVPFTPETTIYRCGTCGGGLHLEESGDEADLACARLSPTCPSCKHPVNLEPGYLGSPQFLEDE